MIRVGDRLGPYEIVARLRSGGMADLYLGRRGGAAGFARYVAIKVVRPHLADDRTFVRMFIDEAKLSARIRHPNVVHVEEFGEQDGSYFMAMEYVFGCSLGDLIRALARRKRRLAPELVVYIGCQVADGLHAAHETRGDDGSLLGVVHRDVSPHNVLLAYQGHVKLIDFGIAKSAAGEHQTTGGSLKGKFRYMSPEQAHGETLDRRSDVYSLGVVLWEALTGRRLLDADNDLKALTMARDPEVKPPREVVPELGEQLDRVVMAALAPDRDARISSCKELRRRLLRAVPEAALMEREQLSDLLLKVLAERIQKQKKALPASVSAEIVPPEVRDTDGALDEDLGQEILENLTHADGGAQPLDTGSSRSNVAADADPAGATSTTPAPALRSEAVAAGDAEAEEEPEPVPPRSGIEPLPALERPVPAAAGAKGRGRVLLAGAAAGVLLTVVVAVAVSGESEAPETAHDAPPTSTPVVDEQPAPEPSPAVPVAEPADAGVRAAIEEPRAPDAANGTVPSATKQKRRPRPVRVRRPVRSGMENDDRRPLLVDEF